MSAACKRAMIGSHLRHDKAFEVLNGLERGCRADVKDKAGKHPAQRGCPEVEKRKQERKGS
jgi:hypothetical protein